MFRKLTDQEIDNLRQGDILSFMNGARRETAVFIGWNDRASRWTCLVKVDGKQYFFEIEKLEIYALEIENMHEFTDYDS